MAHFVVHGALKVQESATVICARQRPAAPGLRSSLQLSELDGAMMDVESFFGPVESLEFLNGWEVLLGQSEVSNFLKDPVPGLKPGEDTFVPMRYGGEWKIAGGHIEPGETAKEAAKRELQEEFMLPDLPLDGPGLTTIRPFALSQTRPINSRSNIMFNFIALEDENPWLRALDVAKINEQLHNKRDAFLKMDHTARREYQQLSIAERAKLAPEVYQVQWVPLVEAVRCQLSSLVPGTYVNEFQRQAFKKIGRRHRAPMFITAAVLLKLEAFPDSNCVREYTEEVTLAELRRREQWLFDGMTQDDVDEAFAKRQVNRRRNAKSRLQELVIARDQWAVRASELQTKALPVARL